MEESEEERKHKGECESGRLEVQDKRGVASQRNDDIPKPAMGDCGDRPVTPRYHPPSPLCGVLNGVGGGVGGQQPPQKTKYDGACRPAARWGSALHRAALHWRLAAAL